MEKDPKKLKFLLNKLEGIQKLLFAVDICLKSVETLDVPLPEITIRKCLDFLLKKSTRSSVSRLQHKCRSLYHEVNQPYSTYASKVWNVIELAGVIDSTNRKQQLEITTRITLRCVDLGVDVKSIYDQTKPGKTFPKHYKTPDTLGLAKEILNNNFALMPILADSLMDLGENDTDFIREGKSYSNWALYHLRNTESRTT